MENTIKPRQPDLHGECDFCHAQDQPLILVFRGEMGGCLDIDACNARNTGGKRWDGRSYDDWLIDTGMDLGISPF